MALLHDSPWTAILPVKQLRLAKSRMSASVLGGAIALAFFRDTVDAVVACPAVGQVVVATSDDVLADAARAAGCRVVDDSKHPGINAAAGWAVEESGANGPYVVLVSDLPCLTSEALASVLLAAEAHSVSFLPDAAGTGTTMWMARSSVNTSFGPESAAVHRAHGAVDLSTVSLPPIAARARRDVDTDEDFLDAVSLGLGRHTLAATSALQEPLMLTAVGLLPTGDVDAVDEAGQRHVLDAARIAQAGFLDVRPGQRLLRSADGSVRLP